MQAWERRNHFQPDQYCISTVAPSISKLYEGRRVSVKSRGTVPVCCSMTCAL